MALSDKKIRPRQKSETVINKIIIAVPLKLMREYIPDPLFPYTVIYAALVTGAVPAGDYSVGIH